MILRKFIPKSILKGIIIAGAIFLLGGYCWNNRAFAQSLTSSPQALPVSVTTTVEKTGGGLLAGVSSSCLKVGDCQLSDVLRVITNIFHLLREIAFYAAIGFGLYGGIRMIISQGKPEGVKAGQKIIEAAFIGLIIAYGASFIINIVCTILLGHPLTLDNILNANWPR
ncbi:MAG: hypothetical protein PHF40_02010 [Candidatus Pacebacteria bacterium]|nr:hypothetical protein [Candidatus Paceibacterota bacterium]